MKPRDGVTPEEYEAFLERASSYAIDLIAEIDQRTAADPNDPKIASLTDSLFVEAREFNEKTQTVWSPFEELETHGVIKGVKIAVGAK